MSKDERLRSYLSSLGGCPASCPDAHRPTHGHRHVRNWAIAHISDVYALDKNFFRLRSPLAARRDAGRASPRARASSAAGGEGLDAPGVADERDHDGDAAGEEDALHDVHAVRPEIQVAGDRPAAGKGGAEHLGADQDRRTEHGQHVLPRDPAIAGGVLFAAHGITPAGAISAKAWTESSSLR